MNLRPRNSHWVFVGKYCSIHLQGVAKYFGTVKVETVNAEMVELQDKCDYHACREYVAFGVMKWKGEH